MIEADTSLLAFLQHEEERARQADLSEERSVALDFYNGEPFGDEEDGRSQLVTRDVAEVTDHMVISIMRTMVSGDRVVEFTATREEDEQALDDATEAIGQQFMNEQDGYQILHDALKAGLLEKTGVIKSYVEKQQDKRIEQTIPAEMLPMLAEQGIKPIEAEPVDPQNEEGDWRVVILEPQPPKFCDIAVPNEEALISPDTRDPDRSAYLAHKTRKTLSELREMGFEDVEGLEPGGFSDTQLSVARDFPTSSLRDDRDGANATVWLLEEYIRYDLNGDGIAEHLCVHRVGTRILDIAEVDEQPLTIWCPVPMQHRLIGQSLADKVMDVQRTRSVLLRQFMDGTYQSNAPRVLVNTDSGMDENTIDDLLTVRPGALIRYKGQVSPAPLQNGFRGGDTLNALQLMMDERENRTGMVKFNQGLDSDAMNKTVGGMAMQQDQNAQMEEYLARNFANAIGKMFAKKYRLMRAHGSKFAIKVDGQYREVDPKTWPDQMSVRVKVGLGSGRKDQKLLYRKAILDTQKECIAGGLSIVGEEHVYNSIRGAVKDMGLGDPADFVRDPSVPETDEQGNPVQKQPKPDPEMAKVEAQQALDAKKLEGQQALSAAEMQHKQQMAEFDAQQRQAEAQSKIDLMHSTAAAEAQLARDKADFEAGLARDKADFEEAQAERRMQMEERLAVHKASLAEQAAIHKNRPGGDLSK